MRAIQRKKQSTALIITLIFMAVTLAPISVGAAPGTVDDARSDLSQPEDVIPGDTVSGTGGADIGEESDAAGGVDGGVDGSADGSANGSAAGGAASGAEGGADGSANGGIAGDGPAVGASGGTQQVDNFSDLSASYADLTQTEKAEILNRLGMLLGDPDRGLMLDIKVRRSDAAVFFTRLLGREQYVVDRAETEYATTRFPDAPEGKWFTPYIAYCTSIGLIVGRTDGYYYPDDSISEKEFANVLLKILGYEYDVDYSWDTLYEFAFNTGLFEDPSYEARTEDNRDYYRRDVCDQVFAVLGLEKKGSSKLLIEELVESGAISEKAALDLGFDLSGLDVSGLYYGNDDGFLGVDADIYDIYHLEGDLLWVVFTKPVTFRDDAIEICQTYDYSKVLTARVEEKTARDMLLRTGEQLPDMDYTVDISNVHETDGTNAGMLSYDFVGYSPYAQKDSPGGLTTLKRDVNALPGAPEPGGGAYSPSNGGGGGSGDVIDGDTTNRAPSGAQTSSTARQAGNADPSAEYFRVVNAYTTASNELSMYFSQPVTETALNPSYYSIVQGSTILCSGSAGQIGASLQENATNAILLTASGFKFTRGEQYRVTVSGRLVSGYTARLNEGNEDSYTFTADNVAERSDSFVLKSIAATSQYTIELEFSQPINMEMAKQAYNYTVLDQNDRKLEISIISGVADSGASSQAASAAQVPSAGAAAGASSTGAAAGSAAGYTAGSPSGRRLRINLSQPILTLQNCTFTIVYAQNASNTASIINQSYQFQYSGQADAAKKSSMALTGAISNDPSTAELYFSQKPDPASAVIASNYSVNGFFDGKNYTVTPLKVSYDPQLTPFMVRLYFQSDRRFMKDHAYSIRVNNSIRDENMLNPDRTLELQFYANNRDAVTPSLKDAVIVGDGIIRLDFSKEIQFDPMKITESNFTLIDESNSVANGAASPGVNSLISPVMVKYINTTTVVLRFDEIDAMQSYRVYFSVITDFSGQYTTRYPDQGSSLRVRNGKR